jgi:hypothetical protein
MAMTAQLHGEDSGVGGEPGESFKIDGLISFRYG